MGPSNFQHICDLPKIQKVMLYFLTGAADIVRGDSLYSVKYGVVS